MKNQCVCILGGTGFVGRHLANTLSASGRSCRVLTRHPQRHRDLKLVPGCEVVGVDEFSAEAMGPAMEGCDALVNLAGILNEGGGRSFEGTHVTLVENALGAADAAGVRRYLHMSALHADAATAPSAYLRTKGRGEDEAHAGAMLGIAVTSFRPSVIFGPGDSFFNRFAGLLRALPGPFPLACAGARFSPVYVRDVCAAMRVCLDSDATAGQRYQLCGPRTFTLRELVEYTGARIGRRVRVIPLGDGLAKVQAKVLEHLPGRPLTTDNLLSLGVDSVCTENGLRALGVKATDIDAVVPGYLH